MYCASIRERRCTNAVAVGATRLTAPPSAMNAMLPAPPRTCVICLRTVWMPAAGSERSKKSERAAYVSGPRARGGERRGVEPGRWHWAAVGKDEQPAYASMAPSYECRLSETLRAGEP